MLEAALWVGPLAFLAIAALLGFKARIGLGIAWLSLPLLFAASVLITEPGPNVNGNMVLGGLVFIAAFFVFGVFLFGLGLLVKRNMIQSDRSEA